MFLTNARLKRYLFALLIGATPLASQAEVLFEENFDDQPDWTSEMYSTETQKDVLDGDTMPVGWDASYTGGGFGNDPIQILASQSDKARGGTGKAFVSWKEHNAERAKQFVSNSTLAKRIEGPNGIGVDQLYAEFWVRFDPNWTAEENQSKFFRVYSSRPGGNLFNAFSGGDSGPLFLFDYRHSNNFGAQNNLTFRGGPWGHNYKPDWPPSVPVGNTNFLGGSMLQQVIDKENGGLIPAGGNENGIVTHDMVWGPPSTGQWTKYGFFVKMNSSISAADGVFMQWIDDLLVLKSEEVQWVMPNSENLTPNEVKWNAIAIGGNDYIGGEFPHPIYPNEAEHEEWYAIDDFVISTEIPERLMNGNPSPPRPPTSIDIN
ncbi:MAG: hypothetical protein ACX936_04835 [Marinobacter sp.]